MNLSSFHKAAGQARALPGGCSCSLQVLGQGTVCLRRPLRRGGDVLCPPPSEGQEPIGQLKHRLIQQRR